MANQPLLGWQQLEAEKSVEELKDKVARLEKDLDEVRDAVRLAASWCW